MPRIPGPLKRHWFLIALCLTLGAAAVAPSLPGGPWQDHLKHLLVAGIFLCSGLALRTRELTRGLTHWRPVLFTQLFSFVATPLMCLALEPPMLHLGMPPALLLGFVVLGALPTTISSCVALTADAGGNQASSIINACLGNLLGVVITPLWLVPVAGALQTDIDILPVLRELGVLVVLPLAVGQLLRRHPVCRLHAVGRSRLNKLSQLLLLGILYLSFQRAFASGGAVPFRLVAVSALLCAGLHALWLWIPWAASASPVLGCDRADRISVLYCASQKTLALGLPLIALCFPGHPDLPLITLPLLIYHPLQLLVGAGLTVRLREGPPAETG